MAQLPPFDPAQETGFQALLARATDAAGARQVHVGRLTVRWALRQDEADVVHLQWLEYIVSVDPTPVAGMARTLVRSARLAAALAVLRARGVGVVYTVHNLHPHEPLRPKLEHAAAQLAYVMADEVIVHSRYARERVRKTFLGRRGRPPWVIPLANYIGVYPDGGPSRAALRERLGIPADAYTYLAFGQVRGYKRLERLAQRFSELRDPDARLLIAGAPKDASVVAALRGRAAADPRIRLWLEHIPDELVSSVHRASDAAVIAYDDVFSSAALLLGLSYGLPVVAPAAGTARELFSEPAVVLFPPDGLTEALRRVRATAGEPQRGAALAAAEAFPWSVVGAQTGNAYDQAAARASARRTWRPTDRQAGGATALHPVLRKMSRRRT